MRVRHQKREDGVLESCHFRPLPAHYLRNCTLLFYILPSGLVKPAISYLFSVVKIKFMCATSDSKTLSCRQPVKNHFLSWVEHDLLKVANTPTKKIHIIITSYYTRMLSYNCRVDISISISSLIIIKIIKHKYFFFDLKSNLSFKTQMILIFVSLCLLR